MNLNKLLKKLKIYKCKLKDSYDLNELSKNYFTKIASENNFVLNNEIKLSNYSELLILNPKSTIESEISSKILFFENKMKVFQVYYMSLTNNHLELFDERFYCIIIIKNSVCVH